MSNFSLSLFFFSLLSPLPFLFSSSPLTCPTDMALVLTQTGPMCVDRYEAKVIVKETGKTWPFNHPVDKLPNGSYYAVPAKDSLPQAYISAEQVGEDTLSCFPLFFLLNFLSHFFDFSRNISLFTLGSFRMSCSWERSLSSSCMDGRL